VSDREGDVGVAVMVTMIAIHDAAATAIHLHLGMMRPNVT
jgi:hypothetical protein